MKIFTSPEQMGEWSNARHREGKTIALVPTMGCLHDGHLSLIDKAKEYADLVIVSIFVNPMQFGPGEDLDAYPRQLEIDCSLIKSRGADLIFAPAETDIYDSSFQTCISITKLASGLCGANRPGHFDGVATVVTKLFNITRPDFAVFGQKDFQQLAIITQLVKDLNIPLQVIGSPIVRETDGLAMSSRNKYLVGEERQTALCLSQSIARAKELVRDLAVPQDVTEIIVEVKTIIAASGATVEYAEIVDRKTLVSQQQIDSNSIIVVAAKIGGHVRLIDNSILQ
ncbi:MAG: pantoate--beta-alanine ligase [Desulfotalea sp.]|nr:MAG: pantoate--beta-alanine ligase [Desulfotalea sp.]